MRGRPLLRPVLTSLLTALLLLGSVTGCSATHGTGDKGYVDGDGVITRLPVSQRHKPGTVAGTTLDGQHVALSQYAGHVVVLNVWGSWCAPCRKEASLLAEADRQLRGAGVDFLGINTRDAGVEQGLAFQRRYGVGYPSLFDPSGATLLAFQHTLNPSAIPSTVVLDAQGRVAASILGPVPSTTTLVDLVKDVRG